MMCEKCWYDAYNRSLADTSKTSLEHYNDLLDEHTRHGQSIANDMIPLNVEQFREGLHLTYSGGHHTDGHYEAFHHGMDTVCNVLKAKAPYVRSTKGIA